MKYNCLIVDDEEMLAEATCRYFNAFDLFSAYVTSSDKCIEFLSENDVSLILLDINLGNSSGFSLCKKLRETMDIPILFISARQSDDDVLFAFHTGGDDYIKKPYNLSVLLAKVNAMLKRTIVKLNNSASSIDEIGKLRIDHAGMRVFIDNCDAGLKTMEFKLFTYLLAKKNQVITKKELFDNVWGDSFFSDGTLNVHIRRLREKIEEDPNSPKIIKTIWGTGYMMEI